MAVDTLDKRASIIGYKLPWLGPLPIPDGVIGSSDRGDILGEYPFDDTDVDYAATRRRIYHYKHHF